jgi:hypothetical protein
MVWSEPSPHDPAPELADPPQYDCRWSDEDYCGSARITQSMRRWPGRGAGPSPSWWLPAGTLACTTGPALARLHQGWQHSRRKDNGCPRAPTIEPAQRPRDPEPYVPEDPLRITGGPYGTAALPSMSWPEAVQLSDQVLLSAVIDRGEDRARLLEPTLRWLNDGLRALLADLERRGIDIR